MALQEGSAELAVCPAGPAADHARAMTLTHGRFLESALRLRRALRAEVGVLLSLLSACPLGSLRRLGFFSAKVQGIDASHEQIVTSLPQQKKFRSCFRYMLLLCIMFFIMFYTLTYSSLSWWESFPLHVHYQRFLNRTKHDNLFSYIYSNSNLKHGVKQNESIEYHQAYAPNYQFVMDNRTACKSRIPFLVLMVPVAPNNVAARNAIRRTWGNYSTVQGETVLTMFMLGLPRGNDVEQQQEKLKQENLQHHDLIQSNFMDTYLNLTIKTMVIMDWLATRCSTAAYAMKIDSDMFLNIDNLVIMLQRPEIPDEKYLTGMLMWNRPVVRSKDSKWYVSEKLYPDNTYPTYCLGMGYVFSNDLPEKLVEVSKTIKPFNIEDAYIGMCMKKLGLGPTSPPNPGQFKAYNWKYTRCEYSKIITYILGSSEELVNYWTDLKKPGPPCG